MQETLNQTAVDRVVDPGSTGPAAPALDELACIKLFTGADDETLESVFQAGELRVLAAHDILIRTGTTNTTLYLLLSGRLSVHLESPANPATAVLEAGESVGELSLIDQRPTSAYVLADVPTRVLAVPQEFFWLLVESSHAVARNLLRSLSQRLRRTDVVAAHHQEMHRHYQRQAAVDELTGLHNRRWIENALRRLVLRCGMNGETLSMILLDIDRFDRYNRAFDDDAGDAVLFAVARTLENALRPDDLVGRYGADGFAILLPGVPVEHARLVARRVQGEIAEAVISLSDQSILPPVTASCGVAQLYPGAGAEGLIAATSAALKDAKYAGTNMLRG
jgi:diguanylate cyclase (GGDEF)-like protein